MRSSPRIQARMKQRLTYEEQLITSLKRQIYHLDPTTKAVLKESLYRISRNTNARVSDRSLSFPCSPLIHPFSISRRQTSLLPNVQFISNKQVQG